MPLSYTKASFCRNLNNVASYCLASLVVSVIVFRRRMFFFFFFRSVSFNFLGTAHIKKNTLSIRLISRPLNIEELSFFAHGHYQALVSESGPKYRNEVFQIQESVYQFRSQSSISYSSPERERARRTRVGKKVKWL